MNAKSQRCVKLSSLSEVVSAEYFDLPAEKEATGATPNGVYVANDGIFVVVDARDRYVRAVDIVTTTTITATTTTTTSIAATAAAAATALASVSFLSIFRYLVTNVARCADTSSINIDYPATYPRPTSASLSPSSIRLSNVHLDLLFSTKPKLIEATVVLTSFQVLHERLCV